MVAGGKREGRQILRWYNYITTSMIFKKGLNLPKIEIKHKFKLAKFLGIFFFFSF